MSDKTTKNPRKERTKNFSTEEIDTIVEEVVKRAGVLFGPLKGPKLTQFHRDRAWDQVVASVNAVGPVHRSLDEIKRKYKDFKNRTKLKANSIRREAQKTGGGENDAAPLNTNELKVIGFIGTASIEGISGGIDTFRSKVVNCPETVPASTPSPIPAPFLDSLVLPPPSPFAEADDEAAIPDPPNPLIPGTSTGTQGRRVSRKRKRSGGETRTAALKQFEKSATLQSETNDLLRELVSEYKDFKQQFLDLKRREVEAQEETLRLKRRKYL